MLSRKVVGKLIFPFLFQWGRATVPKESSSTSPTTKLNPTKMLTNEGFFGCLFSRTTKRGGPVLRTGPERPEWGCVHLFMSNWIAAMRAWR